MKRITVVATGGNKTMDKDGRSVRDKRGAWWKYADRVMLLI